LLFGEEEREAEGEDIKNRGENERWSGKRLSL
jgi:hypothetical protein